MWMWLVNKLSRRRAVPEPEPTPEINDSEFEKRLLRERLSIRLKQDFIAETLNRARAEAHAYEIGQRFSSDDH